MSADSWAEEFHLYDDPVPGRHSLAAPRCLTLISSVKVIEKTSGEKQQVEIIGI